VHNHFPLLVCTQPKKRQSPTSHVGADIKNAQGFGATVFLDDARLKNPLAVRREIVTHIQA
jgi:hypothetical protein